MTQKLTLSLRPSRILALALTVMAAVALVCAWIGLAGAAFLPVAAGIAIAWAWNLAPALRRGKRSVCALELAADGSARWQDGSGQWHDAHILPSSYVSGWLVVMNLGAGSRSVRPLVLLPDCAPAEELRQLRVWLRWRLARA